ncbi:MAG: Long-chain-fatty-acid--CoA ligase FadD13 [Ilumatobacteraceae bacterium]|nr:Long-chain-fatty-acid--CoA ligase FadD13 [Ilumatobacteraceae bacterium]
MQSSVGDIIRTRGTDRADRIAVEYEGRSITYGEIDRRSNKVANALRAAGVEAQDRVGFIDKNGPEYFEVAFGIAKLNAINVGVNWRLTAREMLHIINDAQVKVLVIGPDFVPHIESIESELTTVTTIVVIEGGTVADPACSGHPHWPSYEDWIGDEPEDDPAVPTAPEDIAFLIFTSGTTGLPKGAMMTQQGFFAAFSALDRWLIDEASVSLAMMPMFHFAGSGWSLLGLAVGCRLVLLRDVDPVRILEVIPEFGVTNIVLPPSVIQFMMLTPGADSTDFSSLRAMVYGGSPITETVLAKATAMFGCQFMQIYGLTETAGGVAQLDGADHDPENRPHLLRSCGKAFPWVEIRIVEPDTGIDVAEGDLGELWVRAPQNMPGYWHNPEATAATITPEGWLRTGDAGYRDPDGYIFLKDRVNDMIVSGAENVYPAEVENALMKHPAVTDVAVIGVPDETWGEAVKAIVVKPAGCKTTGAEIIAATREHLAGYKLPKSVDFADELPRNPSGKVLRRVLREPYWTGHTRGIG